MTKQELIEKYKSLIDLNESNIFNETDVAKDCFVYRKMTLNQVIRDLKQLEEPEECETVELFNGHFSDDINKDDPCYQYACSYCKTVLATNDYYDNRHIGKYCLNCGRKIKKVVGSDE